MHAPHVQENLRSLKEGSPRSTPGSMRCQPHVLSPRPPFKSPPPPLLSFQFYTTGKSPILIEQNRHPKAFTTNLFEYSTRELWYIYLYQISNVREKNPTCAWFHELHVLYPSIHYPKKLSVLRLCDQLRSNS
jgi:hypothetical protein